MKNEETQEKNEHIYVGNSIPWPIKAIWMVFIAWLLYYIFSYVAPDLTKWLNK